MEIKERGFGSMNIGGQERGFHIGTYQARVFCEVRGIELADYLRELEEFATELQKAQDKTASSDSKSLPSMVRNQWVCDFTYSALVAYCKFNKIPVDFDADEVTFWTDMASTEETAKPFTVLFTMQRDMPKKSDA
jgi:hypothetical protein